MFASRFAGARTGRWRHVSALDLRLLGRLGGAGLLAGGVALFALKALPHWGTPGGTITLVVSVVTALGGVAGLRTRWSDEATRAGMVLAAGAYFALGVTGLAEGSAKRRTGRCSSSSRPGAGSRSDRPTR